jgi:hypothetical protein
MTGSEAVTSAQAQARAATGHLELPGGALVPAPWVPTTAGSGATLCTAADLGRFLRAVIAADPPLLEPRTREEMLTLAISLAGDRRYEYGLGVELDTEGGYRRTATRATAPATTATPMAAWRPGSGW